jgi:hypothetical protein
MFNFFCSFASFSSFGSGADAIGGRANAGK